jgi:hypothetical protein
LGKYPILKSEIPRKCAGLNEKRLQEMILALFAKKLLLKPIIILFTTLKRFIIPTTILLPTPYPYAL